jgi:hypothetical protein
LGNRGWAAVAGTWLLVLGIIVACGSGTAVAAENEIRDFSIFVDNKKVGSYEMSVTPMTGRKHGKTVGF